MCRKISADVDGGTSGPSSVRRRGARTPIGVSGNFLCVVIGSDVSVVNLLESGNFSFDLKMDEAKQDMEYIFRVL